MERLFSRAKHIYTDFRGGISPYMFECIMFLKMNQDLWGPEEVFKAMRNVDVHNLRDEREKKNDIEEENDV